MNESQNEEISPEESNLSEPAKTPSPPNDVQSPQDNPTDSASPAAPLSASTDNANQTSSPSDKSQQLSPAQFVTQRHERMQQEKEQPQSKSQDATPPKPEIKTPAQSQKQSVAIPVPQSDDIDLENEVAEALGDFSLMDMYGLEEKPQQKMTEQKDTPDKTSQKQKAPGIIKGTVLAVTKDGLFIDLGGKSQGFLPSEELEENEKPQVGAIMEVVIIRYDGRDGLLVVSRSTATQQLLRKNLREGVQVEARVTGTNKGGLELLIKGGLKAFMPVSQIDLGRVEETEGLVGQVYICEVTQVERGDKNVVLSRRNVQAKEQAQKGEQLWQELEEGQTRKGKVRNIADFGAFVDLGGVDGLLHVSEMSWARVNHPKDLLQVGQEVEVIIKSIDKEKKRLSLSLKMAGGDPWDSAEQKYFSGSIHQARVVKLMDFGAFAELEPGIEGLIPISEMTWAGRINHPSDVVKAGDMVEVSVLNLDMEKKRMSLSIKQKQGNPWTNVTEKFVVDNIYNGTVARITDFGAFVTLEPGIDGLVHISELSDKRVNRVADVVKQGQQVDVKVLDVDEESQRISLSMKEMGTVDSEIIELPVVTSTSQTTKKKKDKPRRGGLSW